MLGWASPSSIYFIKSSPSDNWATEFYDKDHGSKQSPNSAPHGMASANGRIQMDPDQFGYGGSESTSASVSPNLNLVPTVHFTGNLNWSLGRMVVSQGSYWYT